MARGRVFDEHRLPRGVVMLVTSILADYERRATVLRDGGEVTSAVLDRYRELNGAVDAALEDLEVAIRRDMMCDIALGRGYRKSCAQYILSKNAYYKRRRKVVYDVALRLKLL